MILAAFSTLASPKTMVLNKAKLEDHTILWQ